MSNLLKTVSFMNQIKRKKVKQIPEKILDRMSQQVNRAPKWIEWSIRAVVFKLIKYFTHPSCLRLHQCEKKLILLEVVSSNYFKRKQFWDVCECSALSNLCGERLEVVQIEDRSALNGPSVAAGTQHLAYFSFFFLQHLFVFCLSLLPFNYRRPMIFRLVSHCFSQIAINPPGYKERERPPPPCKHTHTHTYTEFRLISMSGGSWNRRFLIKNIKIQRKTGMAEIDDPGGISSSICV